MPSNQISIVEPPPIFGMNTVDDPKTLKPGQCVRLLNMFPGNPPIPRNGCPGSYKFFLDEGDIFYPQILVFKTGSPAKDKAICWIKSGSSYFLVTFDCDASTAFLSNGEAVVTDPIFKMVRVYDSIYCFINKTLTSWNSDTKALLPKIYEGDNAVRDICISVAAQVTSVNDYATGGQLSDGYYSYAFQYVRRDDSAAFEAGTTPTGMILPPGITGKPKQVSTFLPGSCIGIENSSYRKSLQVATGASSKATIDIDFAGDHAEAIAQGATHIRISRNSLAQTTQLLADGETKYFIFDAPLLGSGTTTFDDTGVVLTTAQLLTGYSAIPEIVSGKLHLGRLFVIASSGMVYYSETPGGDGAYDLEFSQVYPQAWASLFKPLTYFIDCDSDDGIEGIGIETLGNDIFFFKASKIYALFNGNPNLTDKTNISESIGCPFPHSIIIIEIASRGKCIFFISNRGPAIIYEGGRLELFENFKIAELWPDSDRDLFAQLDIDKNGIINHCTAAWYKNTVWVSYQTSYGSKKIFGYYFNPNDKDVQGPLEISIATEEIYYNLITSNESNLNAYLFGKTDEYLAITEFLKQGSWEDISTVSATLSSSIVEDESGIFEDGTESIEGT